jgi:3',5'-cyclic AMP phosphodiesterase CpdA
MLIAQITDPHIVVENRVFKGRIDTAAWLARAVEVLNAFRPAIDAVVLTGDCVDAGAPAEYARLGDVLAKLRMPLFAIPGNHDSRAAFLACFPEMARRKGDFPFVQYAIDEYPAQLVALDTLDEGKPGGLLCETRLAWLDRTLAQAPDKPTLVFLHHPPFVTGLPDMDAQGLASMRELAAVLTRHPQVGRIAAGHLHRAIEAQVAHAIAATAPATAHQVGLAMAGGTTFGFTLEQPGFRLFHWTPDAGWRSHLATHAPFEGPYDWRDGAALTGS